MSAASWKGVVALVLRNSILLLVVLARLPAIYHSDKLNYPAVCDKNVPARRACFGRDLALRCALPSPTFLSHLDKWNTTKVYMKRHQMQFFLLFFAFFVKLSRNEPFVCSCGVRQLRKVRQMIEILQLFLKINAKGEISKFVITGMTKK